MWLIVFLVLLFFLLTSPSTATAADEAFAAHVEVGLREVHISGDRAKYKQHINEDSGLRLFALGLSYTPEQPENHLPDLVVLDASGQGGDPYQNTRLEIRRYGQYRFRYEHRKSDYFYQDLLITADEIDIASSNEGDLHHFNYERTSDSVDFELQVDQRATLLLAYDRYRKEGDSTTVLDVQREEFELDSPLNQELENVDVGVEYAWDKITLTYHERWRTFENDTAHLITGPSEGLDLLGPTRLDFFTFSQPYRYDSREHQLGLMALPADRWSLRADLLITELDMDVASLEVAQGDDFTGQPFITQDQSVGGAERDTLQLFLSGSYAVSDRVRLLASIREQRLDQDGMTTGDSGDSANTWQLDSNHLSLGVEAAPDDAWVIGGGWSQQKRETRFYSLPGGVAQRLDETTTNDGYWLQLSYRPTKHMDWRASIETNNIHDAYTSASATDYQRIRLRGRYRWDNGMVVTASHLRRDYDNDQSEWTSDSRQTSLRFGYGSDQLTLSVGFSWVDVERRISQLVTGGFRQDLFNIDYQAATSFWDAALQWAVNERWELSASHRDYSNSGTFDTSRDDSRIGISYALAKAYRLQLRYRNTRFSEQPAEQFDAELLELAFEYRR